MRDLTRDARVFADTTLDDPGADVLHRAPFVNASATLLADVLNSEDSVVAALVGPWGSGKSSTLGFVLRELRRRCETAVVVPLNPWMVSGPAEVAHEVVTAVATALQAAGVKPTVVKAGRGYFRAVARAAVTGAGSVGGAYAEHQGLGIGPELGGAAGDVLVSLLDASGQRTPPGVSAPATLQLAAASLAEALREHGRGVLIVIEDVDRLQPDELLALIKAVRLLGRLPHVHHLLVYDEETVLDLLAQMPVAHGKRDRGLAYLEKVVPLRLEQPEVTDDHVDDLLAEGYRTLKDALPTLLERSVDDAFEIEAELLLRHALTTPRAVPRFFAQLRFVADLMGPGRVDVADLAVLTLLRLHHPPLYRALGAERRLLTGQRPADMDDDALQRRLDAVVRKPDDLTDREWRPVREAVHRIFPASVGPRGAETVLLGSPRPQRAQDPDYVGRYFALSPLAGDDGDVDLAGALDALSRGARSPDTERFLDLLLHVTDRRTATGARRLLRRTSDHLVAHPPTPEAAAALVGAFLRLAPYPRVGSVSTDQAAVVLIGYLLHRVGTVHPPPWGDLVRRLVTSAPLRPGHRGPGEALWLLVRACTSGVPVEHRLDVEGLPGHLLDAGWEHVLTGVREGGDDVGPEGFGPWLVRMTEPFEVERRIDGMWESGADPSDLVARLLPLRQSEVSPDPDALVLEDDPVVSTVIEGVVSVAGLDGLRSRLAESPPHELGAAAPHRRVARKVLTDRVNRIVAPPPAGSLTRTSLPGATTYETVAPTPCDEDDIRVVMTVVAPAAPLPLAELDETPDEVGTLSWVDRWEDRVRAGLDRSPVTDWLLTGRPGSPAPPAAPDWDPKAVRGHRISYSAEAPVARPTLMDLLEEEGDVAPARRRVFVQAMPGLVVSSGTSGAVVVLDAGLRLPRPQREPTAEAGHPSAAVVEAASLADIATILLALLRSAPLAGDARVAIPEVTTDPVTYDPGAVVHLALLCSDDLATVVDLDLPGRMSTTPATQFRRSAVTEDLRALRNTADRDAAPLFVRALLTRWLRDAEYRRGVDHAVDAAVSTAVELTRHVGDLW